MKKIRIGAALLAALMLTGCTAKEEKTGDKGDGGDIVAQTLGVARDTTILTIDGVELDAERYLFWLVNSIETQK